MAIVRTAATVGEVVGLTVGELMGPTVGEVVGRTVGELMSPTVGEVVGRVEGELVRRWRVLGELRLHHLWRLAATVGELARHVGVVR
jgi:large-conductance mechanosensitive channel